MVLDDSGNIVGYRHRTQQEDGSWLWTDIEDPNAEHYEKVDGLDHIYKVTDKDGTSSYQQYVRNEDGSYAYVPVNENGVPLDDGADATTTGTTTGCAWVLAQPTRVSVPSAAMPTKWRNARS